MNEPQINVDHFYHRPVYHVVGLLTDKSEISAISSELASAGVDVAGVEMMLAELELWSSPMPRETSAATAHDR